MNLNVILIIALVLMTMAVIVLIVALIRRAKAPISDSNQETGLKLILEQVNELSRTVDRKVADLTKTVDSKITESSKSVQDSMRNQLSESAKIIREVTQGLTKLDETNRQVVSFADQLKNLQDILKNPKQRGILGEYYLETLLRNVMAPGQYALQYKFRDGEIADAVIFINNQIVPIDSKFSLENYNRMVEEKNPVEREKIEKIFVNDLKIRIQETAKYIKPLENTMDFALMFIPHEAIYYDLLTNRIGASNEDGDNLIQRAANRFKVIITSPTSLFAYLQTVIQGLKALQIEEKAKDIVKHVIELGNHLKRYEDYHNRLGNSLGTVVNHYNNSGKELKKVDKDILRIAGETPGIEVQMLEKAEVGEQ